MELDDDAIAALIEIAKLLRQMRAESEAEGYRFEGGIILPPDQGV